MKYIFKELTYRTKLYSTFLKGSYRQTAATLQPPLQFDYRGNEPIIMVPGLFCTPSVMNRLAKKLYKQGFDIFLAPKFPFYFSALANTCRLKESAEIFKDYLKFIHKNFGIEKINVVGHSNGALIPALAVDLSKNENDNKTASMISGIISMGGPFLGSSVAKIAQLIVPQAKDIVPGSACLNTIGKYKKLYKYHFISGFDALVAPENQYFPENPHKIFSNFQHMDFIVGSNLKVEFTAQNITEVLKGGKNV